MLRFFTRGVKDMEKRGFAATYQSKGLNREKIKKIKIKRKKNGNETIQKKQGNKKIKGGREGVVSPDKEIEIAREALFCLSRELSQTRVLIFWYYSFEQSFFNF